MPAPRHRDARPPQVVDSEIETLVGFLDYLREGVATKVEGAPEPGVRTPGVPSGTSVLGLVTHLTSVERVYFLGARVTDWPATMHPDPEHTVDDVVAAYRDTVARANEVIAGYTDLSRPAPVRAGRAGSSSMRWLLVHMIEETGRHAGHADILREQLDGTVGR